MAELLLDRVRDATAGSDLCAMNALLGETAVAMMVRAEAMRTIVADSIIADCDICDGTTTALTTVEMFFADATIRTILQVNSFR